MKLLTALKNKLSFLILGVVLLAISAAFSVTLLHRLNHTMQLRQQAIRVQSKITALDQRVKEWLLLSLAYNDSPSTELFIKKEMVESSTYELFDDLKERLANDQNSYERLLNLELEWKKINTVLPSHNVLDYFSFETKQLEKAQLDAIGIHGPLIDSNFKLIYVMSTILLILSTFVIGTALILFRREQRLNNQLIDELRVSKDEAQASSRLKSQILATVSHEIRTPLNGIIGMCDILSHRSDLDPRVRKKIQVIMASGQTLTHIINDILNFSKAEAGKIVTNKANFNLFRLCQNIIESLHFQAGQKGVALQLDYEDSLTHHFEGDKELLSQILYNLIGNAVKFTSEGHVRLQISKAGKNKIDIVVEDTGIGIEKESLSKIFEPFYQARNINAKQGTGLGLAICKRLIEMLNGRVSVTSTLGVGTKFHVKLPLVESEVSLVQGTTSPKSEGSKKPPKFIGLRTLIAEDNATNQLIITKMLELLNIDYKIAENGQAALRLVEAETFDCVFMDCQMPVMDGYEATKQIRTKGLKIPIFAMTANAAEENVDQCLAVGMDGFISKPISLNEVIQVLTDNFKDHVLEETVDPEKVTLTTDASMEDSVILTAQTSGLNLNGEGLSFESDQKQHLYCQDSIQETLEKLTQETNESVVLQILDSFKSALGKLSYELHNEIEDLSNLRKVAHKYKSSASLIGADTLAQTLKSIETSRDLQEAKKHVEFIKKILPELTQYLDKNY
ncbi:MAG: ATP-binding protein [Bdellovibrionaceae bacterium]|nr:ATP-binding protein [Pseudobdellovibrionaceae bacterium]